LGEQGKMVNILDAITGMTGQQRTAALRDLGRSAEYYVPPELRGILGFAAEMTPSETLSRAGAAGREMMAPGRTPMQRVGSAGQMLSETSAVAAPAAVAGRAAMPAAQAVQEAFMGFSVPARAAGEGLLARATQPGPVPTMYSNPLGRAADDGLEATLRSKYPDAKIYISGDANRGYTLSQIELPKDMRNSGIGSNIMQDFVSMADAQNAKINLTPSKAFGGSVARLKDFYKRFGFVENKGRNKDFSTRETMYREPSPKGLLDDVAGGPAGFADYLKRVNPRGVRVAAEDRPNLMMGDMYGMLPSGAKRVGKQGDVSFYRGPDGDFYATAFNPDVGEQDVVGYIMPRGDMTELAVVSEMQGKGVGGELQYLFRKENPNAPTGGLTEAGEKALRKTYERLSSEGLLPRKRGSK
jgi:GNAT superfamily N-acetyltransferase